MKKIILLVFALLLWVTQAWAVPVLQIGAPAGTGDSGVYADYLGTTADPLTDPTETETAVTSGSTLYVAGTYQTKDVVSLGGKYDDGTLAGVDWSGVEGSSYPSAFDGHGAILVVTVPQAQVDESLLATLDQITVNGVAAFLYSTDESYFPNEHAPLNSTDPDVAYFFFDIGEFGKIASIPDFFDETTGDKLGEILELAISITGFDWVHFDVMALQNSLDTTTGKIKTEIISTVDQNNPGSHDVTWKDGSPDDDGEPDPNAVPEPGTIILFGLGIVGLAVLRRK